MGRIEGVDTVEEEASIGTEGVDWGTVGDGEGFPSAIDSVLLLDLLDPFVSIASIDFFVLRSTLS